MVLRVLARIDARPPGDPERGRGQRAVARAVARQPEILTDPALAPHRRQLASWARLAPHLLDDGAEERIARDATPVVTRWTRAVLALDDDPDTSTAGADASLGALEHDDPDARAAADENAHRVAVRRAPTMAAALVTLSALQHDDDTQRGISDWRSRGALVQGTSAEALRSVIDVVAAEAPLAQRWVAGRVTRYADRRYVPGGGGRDLPSDARLAGDVLAGACPRLAGPAREAARATRPGPVSECRIDAAGRLAVTVLHRGTLRSSLTVGHEVAHAVHALVVGSGEPPGALVGESVACVGSLLVGGVLAGDEPAPSPARLALGDLLVEEVFLSVAASRFEDAVHRAVADGATPSADDLDALWFDVHRDLYGDAVALPDSLASGWARHPELVTRPGHALSYAWGSLAALAALEPVDGGGHVEDTVLAGAVDADEQLALLGLAPRSFAAHGITALRRVLGG